MVKYLKVQLESIGDKRTSYLKDLACACLQSKRKALLGLRGMHTGSCRTHKNLGHGKVLASVPPACLNGLNFAEQPFPVARFAGVEITVIEGKLVRLWFSVHQPSPLNSQFSMVAFSWKGIVGIGRCSLVRFLLVLAQMAFVLGCFVEMESQFLT